MQRVDNNGQIINFATNSEMALSMKYLNLKADDLLGIAKFSGTSMKRGILYNGVNDKFRSANGIHPKLSVP